MRPTEEQAEAVSLFMAGDNLAVEAVQAQRDAAFSRYVGAAIDELDGMMKIAALVEGSTPQEVRQKVEG